MDRSPSHTIWLPKPVFAPWTQTRARGISTRDPVHPCWTSSVVPDSLNLRTYPSRRRFESGRRKTSLGEPDGVGGAAVHGSHCLCGAEGVRLLCNGSYPAAQDRTVVCPLRESAHHPHSSYVVFCPPQTRTCALRDKYIRLTSLVPLSQYYSRPSTLNYEVLMGSGASVLNQLNGTRLTKLVYLSLRAQIRVWGAKTGLEEQDGVGGAAVHGSHYLCGARGGAPHGWAVT
ncbi:hypothetical protein Sjap_022174 [Stephania japonica]|uniref:Uncharacterized protein n=1 Tax=Stephania japonica TaxID=461633 RepID=A0AAP0ETR2_9MAGN